VAQLHAKVCRALRRGNRFGVEAEPKRVAVPVCVQTRDIEDSGERASAAFCVFEAVEELMLFVLFSDFGGDVALFGGIGEPIFELDEDAVGDAVVERDGLGRLKSPPELNSAAAVTSGLALVLGSSKEMMTSEMTSCSPAFSSGSLESQAVKIRADARSTATRREAVVVDETSVTMRNRNVE